ncbi:MAG: hypothetical protein ACOCQR_03325 [bacterium]
MAFIREYNEGDYNITQYTGGGTIRNRLNDEIVASYMVGWTADESIHPETQEQIDHIEEKLGVKISL